LLFGLFSIPAPLSFLLAGLNLMDPSALAAGLAGCRKTPFFQTNEAALGACKAHLDRIVQE